MGKLEETPSTSHPVVPAVRNSNPLSFSQTQSQQKPFHNSRCAGENFLLAQHQRAELVLKEALAQQHLVCMTRGWL